MEVWSPENKWSKIYMGFTGETPHFTLLLGPRIHPMYQLVFLVTPGVCWPRCWYVDLSDNKTEAVGFTHTADLYTPLDGNRLGPPENGGKGVLAPTALVLCFCVFFGKSLWKICLVRFLLVNFWLVIYVGALTTSFALSPSGYPVLIIKVS